MRARSPLTIKPDTREGYYAVLDADGDVVSAGVARPSSVEGYVTLVPLAPDGPLPTIRVPADWLRELGRVSE